MLSCLAFKYAIQPSIHPTIYLSIHPFSLQACRVAVPESNYQVHAHTHKQNFEIDSPPLAAFLFVLSVLSTTYQISTGICMFFVQAKNESVLTFGFTQYTDALFLTHSTPES